MAVVKRVYLIIESYITDEQVKFGQNQSIIMAVLNKYPPCRGVRHKRVYCG